MLINQFVISFQLEVLQVFQRLAAQSQRVPHNVVLQGESCRRYQVGIVLLHQGGNVSGGKQGVQPLVVLVGKEHILKPKKAAVAYRDYLKNIAKDYKGIDK